MNRIVLLALLFMSSFINNVNSQSEDCSCKSDLIFLDGKVRNTPSYKMNKKSYEKSYSSALEKAGSINSVYNCHILLNTLLLSLNDNHSKVYSSNKGATKEIKDNLDKFAEFKMSKIFNVFPKPNIKLDSLKTVLSSKQKADIEGIYTINDFMTLGVYKNKKENNYLAIVLNSETDIWVKGEIVYTLVPFGSDHVLSIGGSLSAKRLIAYTERIADGFFYFMGFQKDSTQTNYSNKALSDKTYYRKELNNKITYLKIGSFNSWYPTLSDAEKFYKTLDGSLAKNNLIIDLRNNGGGGDRNSDILYKIVKSYAKKNKVYVLINHGTMSNAEQFAYRLSKLANCQLFGDKTNGTLAYEIKDSNYTLPCGNFVAVLTSKKIKEYLEFESQGIKPNVTLNKETDWVTQLIDFIEKNN